VLPPGQERKDGFSGKYKVNERVDKVEKGVGRFLKKLDSKWWVWAGGSMSNNNAEVQLVNTIDEIWKYVASLHSYTLLSGRSVVNIYSGDILVYWFPFHVTRRWNACISWM
jgi:hypothetical protein